MSMSEEESRVLAGMIAEKMMPWFLDPRPPHARYEGTLDEALASQTAAAASPAVPVDLEAVVHEEIDKEAFVILEYLQAREAYRGYRDLLAVLAEPQEDRGNRSKRDEYVNDLTARKDAAKRSIDARQSGATRSLERIKRLRQVLDRLRSDARQVPD